MGLGVSWVSAAPPREMIGLHRADRLAGSQKPIPRQLLRVATVTRYLREVLSRSAPRSSSKITAVLRREIGAWTYSEPFSGPCGKRGLLGKTGSL